MSSSANRDAALLELSRALPSDAIRTDDESCWEHAADDSGTSSVRPDAVIVARTTEQVSAALRIAHAHDIFVTPRAAGTGRTGGAIPANGGFVLSMQGMRAFRDFEKADSYVVVEPGLVLGNLYERVEAENYFYPPDPNSWGSCQIGGNLAENAGGPRAFKYGVTRDYVLGMRAVLMDGTVIDVGRRTSKGVTGYDVTSLLVGSEGTLAVFTEAMLRVIPKPEKIVALIALMPSSRHAALAVNALLAKRIRPRCVEFLDHVTLDVLRPKSSLPIDAHAKAMLLIELDGSEIGLENELESAGNALTDAGALSVLVARTDEERERVWAPRREMSHALRKLAKHKLSEDVVVPRSQLPALLDAVTEISAQHNIVMPAYGHAGDGNVHVNFLWNDESEYPRVRLAIEALFRKTISLGGTLSGEHGIGLEKAPFLGLEQSSQLIALQEKIKSTFDPKGLLNPGKIFPNARSSHRAC